MMGPFACVISNTVLVFSVGFGPASSWLKAAGKGALGSLHVTLVVGGVSTVHFSNQLRFVPFVHV